MGKVIDSTHKWRTFAWARSRINSEKGGKGQMGVMLHYCETEESGGHWIVSVGS